MQKNKSLLFSFLLLLLTWFNSIHAEEGIFIVHVSDTQNRPMTGVILGTKGGGSAEGPTGLDGKTRIRLALETKSGSWVTLQIVQVVGHKDLVFISPWNRQIRVPPFENESENFAPIVVAKRGDRALLESGEALLALAARINETNAPKSVDERLTDEERKENLKKIVQEYGLKPEDVDQAIRVWGKKTKDPYEKGLAALYAENYPEATEQLSESLRIREKEFEEVLNKVVDAAFFLGKSLYQQGRYRESLKPFEKAASLRKVDPKILNEFGLALHKTAEYAKADSILKMALTIREQEFGLEHPDVAESMNGLADLYKTLGRFAEADSLFRTALKIREKTFSVVLSLLFVVIKTFLL